MRTKLARGHIFQISIALALAAAPMTLSTLAQSAGGAQRVALYAGVGEELIAFSVDTERATLTRQSSVMLPGFVQEAWASSSGPFLYVAWRCGGDRYRGSGGGARGRGAGVRARSMQD